MRRGLAYHEPCVELGAGEEEEMTLVDVRRASTKVRRSFDRFLRDLADRDEVIVATVETGETQRAVAKAAELTPTRVKQIVRERAREGA
jgi:hypothetical protein